jgi:hypothetical protein
MTFVLNPVSAKRRTIVNSERSLARSGHGRRAIASWHIQALPVAAGLALICLFAGTYSYGRLAQAAAARADAVEIDEENHAFCATLGLTSQSDGYGQCTFGLGEIRRHHEERLNARAAGIL